MAKITYTDKVALNENSSIADINKVNASDMNEIKTVVNGIVSDSYSTDTETAYSCNYTNRIGKLLWEGSFSSGSITVPGISGYTVVAMIVGGVTCLGSQLYGGCVFTTYNSLTTNSYGYRFTYSAANDRLTIDSLNKGGTNGSSVQPITKIYGVF